MGRLRLPKPHYRLSPETVEKVVWSILLVNPGVDAALEVNQFVVLEE